MKLITFYLYMFLMALSNDNGHSLCLASITLNLEGKLQFLH